MNTPNILHTSLQLILKNKLKKILFIISVWGYATFFCQDLDSNGYTVFYYENGRVASEGSFKQGLPDGLWKSYYEDGTLKSMGSKNLGKSEGFWLFYDSEGRKKFVYDFIADKKNGCASFYDTLGNVTKEIYYLDDVVQDEIIEYYASGKIKKRTGIKDGKEVGLALEYNEQGEVITEEIYDNGFLKDRKEFNRLDLNGQKTGVWRTYFPNGAIETEIAYQNGTVSGLSKTFDLKGKLIDLKEMVVDSLGGSSQEVVMIDMYKEFYPTGKLKLLGGIDGGLKTGMFREYDEQGQIITGYIYERDTLIAKGFISGDGVFQGAWNYYYKTGVVMAKGEYVNSKKEGKWIYYYENGKKEQEGSYAVNKLKGEWNWYYMNGTLQRKEFFNKNEQLEGLVVEYDSIGNEIAKGEYYNGVREGEWFYHVGDYKEIGAFSAGLENGVWNYYYKNGKLAFTGEFVEGQRKGKHIYYYPNGLIKEVGKYVAGVKHGKWIAYNNKGEQIQELEYKRGELDRIDGFKVIPIVEEN